MLRARYLNFSYTMKRLKRTSVVLFLTILLTICLLLYIFKISRRSGECLSIQRAALDSEFKQCEFIIYDKSLKDACDRLIIIEPFNWVLWNTRKNLFVLNPEKNIQCTGKTDGAIRMLENEFHETCLDVSFDYIIKYYTSVDTNDVNVYRIPYIINDKVFKITDAINRLLDLDLLQYDLMKTNYNDAASSNKFTFNRLGTYIQYKRNVYDYKTNKNEHYEIIRHNENTRYNNGLNSKLLFIDKKEEDVFLDNILQNVYLEREIDVIARRNCKEYDATATNDETGDGRNVTGDRT